MTTILLILSSLTLIFILLTVYLKNRRFSQKTTSLQHKFFTSDESVKFITSKANLTAEENEKLKILLPLAGSNRLHMAFEDEEIARKWLINTKRVLYHTNQFEADLKEELEYSLYEIFRKMNNARISIHPSIKKIKDINSGQQINIKISQYSSIQGEILDIDTRYIYILLREQYYNTITPEKILKKRIQISFWKKLDAGYCFFSEIIDITSKQGSHMMIIKNPHKISREKIREYPRSEAEIPARLKQIIISPDLDTGGSKKDYSRTLLGIINNIGTNGCSIISHVGINIESLFIIEFPLFNEIINIHGIVRNTFNHGDIYILHIEFLDDINRSALLKIYHYIFADKII